MKVHQIEMAAIKLEPSIWNTAKYFKEGRNILIVCLAKGARKTEKEVVQWLKDNNKDIKDLDKYFSDHDSD